MLTLRPMAKPFRKLPVANSGIYFKGKPLEEYGPMEQLEFLRMFERADLIRYIGQLSTALVRVREMYRIRRDR